MKNIVKIICLNFIPPLLLLIIIPSIFIRTRQGTSQNQGGYYISFVNNKPVSFSFVSNKSNLESLSIDFKNPGLNNTSPITFEIIGPNNKQTITFSGSNIGDPSTVPLKFTPFNDPPQTNYQINLSTDNTDHSSLYIITNLNQQPVFNSYYVQPDILTRLSYNLNNQFDQLLKRSLVHNILYFCLIIYINYLLFK